MFAKSARFRPTKEASTLGPGTYDPKMPEHKGNPLISRAERKIHDISTDSADGSKPHKSLDTSSSSSSSSSSSTPSSSIGRGKNGKLPKWLVAKRAELLGPDTPEKIRARRRQQYTTAKMTADKATRSVLLDLQARIEAKDAKLALLVAHHKDTQDLVEQAQEAAAAAKEAAEARDAAVAAAEKASHQVDSVRQSLVKAVGSQAAVVSSLRTVQMQYEDSRALHLEEMRNVWAQRDQAIAEARADGAASDAAHAAKIRDIQNQYQEILANSKEDARREAAAVVAQYSSAMREMRAEYEARMGELTAALDEGQAASEETTLALAQAQAELAAAEADAAELIAEAVADAAESAALAAQATGDAGETLRGVEEDFATRLAAVAAEADARVSAAVREHTTNHQVELEQMKEAHVAELARARAAVDATLAAQTRQHEIEMLGVRAQVESLESLVASLTGQLTSLSSNIVQRSVATFANSPYKKGTSSEASDAAREKLEVLQASVAEMLETGKTVAAEAECPMEAASFVARQVSAVVQGAFLAGEHKLQMLRSDRDQVSTQLIHVRASLARLQDDFTRVETELAWNRDETMTLSTTLAEAQSALAEAREDRCSTSASLAQVREMYGARTEELMSELREAECEGQAVKAKLAAARSALADSNALIAEFEGTVEEMSGVVMQLNADVEARTAEVVQAEAAVECLTGQLSAIGAVAGEVVAETIEQLTELDLLDGAGVAELERALGTSVAETLTVLARVLTTGVNVSQFELAAAETRAEKAAAEAESSKLAAVAEAKEAQSKVEELSGSLTRMQNNLNTMVRNAAITQRRKDEEELEDMSAVADALQMALNEANERASRVRAELISELSSVRKSAESATSMSAALKAKLKSTTEKATRMRSDMARAIQDMEAENATLKATLISSKSKPEADSTEMAALVAEKEALSAQVASLTEANAALGGHENRKQKIKFHARVVNENRELKKKVLVLQSQLEKTRLANVDLKSSLSRSSLKRSLNTGPLSPHNPRRRPHGVDAFEAAIDALGSPFAPARTPSPFTSPFSHGGAPVFDKENSPVVL